jgi:hypothetical protein
MPGIDLQIFKHEIKTYLDAKHVRQCLRDGNPQKAPAIKVEVEKLLNVGFIYPVPLTEWVSNPVPMNKNKGTILLCMDFHDLKKSCPKENFRTPFIDQILDDQEANFFLSWMDFQGITKFILKSRTKIRWHLFSLGVFSHTERCLSNLKMSEPPSNEL